VEQAEQGRSLKIDYIICAALTAVALAVRFYGIRYGLPFPLKADEPYIIDSAVGNFYSQSPIILGWPGSFLVLILFVFYFLYYLALKALGSISSVEDLIFMYWNDPSTFYLIGRVFVAVTGAATVAVLYRMASKMHCRTTAVLSSAFLTFAFMHMRHSHFALPDVPMTLILVLLVYLSYLILEGAGSLTYVVAGALCGLAVALKFNAAMIVLPLLLAHFLAGPEHRTSGWRNLSLLLLSIPVFFYIGCPYILTDPGAVLESIRTVVIDQKTIGNTRAIATSPVYLYLFGTVLPKSAGWPMVVMSVAGLLVLLVRPARKDLLVMSYPVLYALLLSTSKTLFLRYAIPLIPFMALLSGVFIVRAGSVIKPDAARKAAVVLLSAVILLPQFWNTVMFGHMLTQTDTRVEARKWILEQIPGGSSIVLDSVPFSVPMGFGEWVLNYERLGGRWGPLKYKYLNARSADKVNSYVLRYTLGEMSEDFWEFDPNYVIVSSYVKSLFYGASGKNLAAKMPKTLERRRAYYDRVEAGGDLLMVFTPAESGTEEPDDVYGVDVNPRPGPVIKIYRMRDADEE